MNKIYIVHCWSGKKEDGWYPWLDNKISDNNNQVIRFDMPDTDYPKIDVWVNELDKYVDNLDENTYFVGHSIGCQTIMRYLEKQDKKIGGILFVTPWLDLLPKAVSDEESNNIAYPWLNTKIDFEKIKSLTNNITCIFSDNDYFVPIEQEKEFRKKLSARTIIIKGKGHMSDVDGITKSDEIYDELKKIIER